MNKKKKKSSRIFILHHIPVNILGGCLDEFGDFPRFPIKNRLSNSPSKMMKFLVSVFWPCSKVSFAEEVYILDLDGQVSTLMVCGSLSLHPN